MLCINGQLTLVLWRNRTSLLRLDELLSTDDPASSREHKRGRREDTPNGPPFEHRNTRANANEDRRQTRKSQIEQS